MEDFIEPIQAFIDRLNRYPDLTVDTNRTSTQVTGEYGYVMRILGEEMQRTHESVGQAIFVAKFLNFDAMTARSTKD